MTVEAWLAAGALELPLPGSGATLRRWRGLSALTEIDVVGGRLAEAHADAVAILAELDGPAAGTGQLWGVWAAEAPQARLMAEERGDIAVLTGTKAWCSGAGRCSHALVTAGRADGERGLYAVALDDPGVRPRPSTWRNAGMARSDTRDVDFDAVRAVAVGAPGQYLSRPGFWFGAVGVAACWYGGARAVAAPLYRAAGRGDDHTLAHLGAVDAALAAAAATLEAVARRVDEDPADGTGTAQLWARRTRAVVETAVDEAITRTARALGPAPLCLDEAHARAVADLSIYVRQSHAERDLAALGGLTEAAP